MFGVRCDVCGRESRIEKFSAMGEPILPEGWWVQTILDITGMRRIRHTCSVACMRILLGLQCIEEEVERREKDDVVGEV